MSDPRVLVTGGSGFVGSTILHLIVDRHNDWTLIVADLYPPEKEFASENSIEFVQTDVTDEQQCLRAVKLAQPTLIIHAAGRVPGGLVRYGKKGREEVFAVNVGGTKNMITAAQMCGVSNFLFTGSQTCITDDVDHEYPNFTEEVPFPEQSLNYGASKVGQFKLTA